MVRSRVLLVMLGLPAAWMAACGGGVIVPDNDPSANEDVPNHPVFRPAFDASRRDVAAQDATPDDCACTDELPQIDGTCTFTIAPNLVACIAEHSIDAGYTPLATTSSCKGSPTAWTPTTKTTEIQLCSCVPGEKHSLCARYF